MSVPSNWILSSRFWPNTQFTSFLQNAWKKQLFWFGATPQTLSSFPRSSIPSHTKCFLSYLIWNVPVDLFSEKHFQNEVQKLLDAAQVAKEHQIPAIVLDCFEIPTTNASKRFEKLLLDLQEGSEKAQTMLQQWKTERQSNQKEVTLALCRLLFSLLKRESEILFCLSPRYHLDQVPLFSEVSSVFEELKRFPHLRYWHHTAYTKLQEHLGLQPHEVWLNHYGSRLYGITLQDVTRFQAGLPPGIGDVSFDILKDLPETCLKSIEFSELKSWFELELAIAHLNKINHTFFKASS